MYDLLIIGGGPAGISAAIYAARKKLKTLLVTKSFGGQMMEAYQIDNYLGLPGLLGVELNQKFLEHLKIFEKKSSGGAYDLEIKEGETVEKIGLNDGGQFEIKTDKNVYQAKSIIIATGKTERKLNIPGAKEFEGKGISYCPTCDAPLFRDKIVAVIGAGDAGQDTAWQLTNYARKVYLLNKYPTMRGDNMDLCEKLEQHPKVTILSEVVPKEIIGEKFVNGLIYEDKRTKEQKKIEVNGIFVQIGSTPDSFFVNNFLKCNEIGEIIIDHNTCAASFPGIFAAGDVTDSLEKQIMIAAGEGAKAALSAYKFLRDK